MAKNVYSGVSTCTSDLEERLRRCLQTHCTKDYGSYFHLLGFKENVVKTFKIIPLKKTCQVIISSPYFKTKSCQLEHQFNRLFQDAEWLSHNVDYQKKMYELQKEMEKVEDKQGLEKHFLIKRRMMSQFSSNLHAKWKLNEEYPNLKKYLLQRCRSDIPAENPNLAKKMQDFLLKKQLAQSQLMFKLYPIQNDYLAQERQRRMEFLAPVNKACQQGELLSCERLLAVYLQEENNREAVLLAKKLCLQKEYRYCPLAARLFLDQKQYDSAMKMSKLACDQKDAEGCFIGSQVYCQKGRTDLALYYLNAAIELGFKNVYAVSRDRVAQCFKGEKAYQKIMKDLL
jgi:hypothetical protein